MAGQQVMAAPDAVHTARRHLDALQHQLVRHPQGAVARMLKRYSLDLGLQHQPALRPTNEDLNRQLIDKFP